MAAVLAESSDGASSTWMQIDRAIQAGCIAILPFGALEQHGPHLPLSTDTVMASGLACRLARELPSILLPPIPYGETSNNDGFPGTVSLGFDTVRSIVLDICRSLRAQGVLGLAVINGDFGNQAPLRVAARQARQELGFPMVVIDYPGLEELAAEICDSAPAGPGFYHADEVETSVVLALRPDLVHMEQAHAEYPDFPIGFGSTPVRLRDISVSGVFGDPVSSTAAKGERLLDGLASRALVVLSAFVADISGSPAPGS